MINRFRSASVCSVITLSLFTLLLGLARTTTADVHVELLLVAIKSGDHVQVKSLLDSGIDPNTISSNGNRPLYTAVLKGDAAIAKILIDGNADINAIKRTGNASESLLHLAVIRNKLEIVELLISEGVDIDPTNDRGFTPLNLASARSDVSILKALVEASAKVNTVSDSGISPLINSMRNAKNTDNPLFLEQSGAILNVERLAKQSCEGCHGAGGISAGKFDYVAHLAGQNKEYLVKQLTDYREGIRHNRIMKKPAASLTNKVVAELAEYYSRLPAIKPVPHSDIDIFMRGQLVFNSKVSPNGLPSCAGCHGAHGLGMPGSMIPRIAGLYPKYLSVQLKNYKNNKRVNDANSVMRLVSATLNEQEIEELAFYVRHMK